MGKLKEYYFNELEAMADLYYEESRLREENLLEEIQSLKEKLKTLEKEVEEHCDSSFEDICNDCFNKLVEIKNIEVEIGYREIDLDKEAS